MEVYIPDFFTILLYGTTEKTREEPAVYGLPLICININMRICIDILYQMGWPVGRASTSLAGRSGNPKIAGSSSDPASLISC